MKKFGLKLLNFLPFLFLFLAIALIVQIVVSLKNERTPTIFGYGMFLVVSPSMEDEIMTGDLIFVNTKATEFNEQDIITFHQPGEESIIITHKIVNKVSTPTGYLYTTKGVNNPESLEWEKDFTDDYIIGKYVGKSTFLGNVYRFVFTGRVNFIYAISILVFLMIAILEVTNIVKEVTLHKHKLAQDDKERMVQEELEKLKKSLKENEEKTLDE
ncbi:MAG: signal peptidase I [Candidatus Izemoplasmatales bacterium]|jgi:signal peptidase